MKKIFPASYLPGARQEKLCIAFSAALSLLILAVDQITKIVVMHCFALHESVPVIRGILSWTYVRNRGAAWGILSGRTVILLIIALAVLALMVKFFRYLTEGYAERIIALGLVISGIFGNSIDRLWHGEVIDFIDVHYKNVWQYPVFNVADIAICTGVGLFILSNLLRKKPESETK